MHSISEKAVARLPLPTTGNKVHFFSGAILQGKKAPAGFGVRVTSAGTKSFVLNHGPRRQRETIGRVGVISLHDARAEAKLRLAQYTLGKTRPRAAQGGSRLSVLLVLITYSSFFSAPRRHAILGETVMKWTLGIAVNSARHLERRTRIPEWLGA